jgi:lysophospholipase L1-like esterase
MHKDIYVFGDSVAFGKYDQRGGWASRLTEFCETNYLAGRGGEAYIYNLSISGNHTGDILERFEAELKPRFTEKKDTVIIFAIGLNDSAYVYSKKDNWVNFADFQENLRDLFGKAKNFSDKIVFAGPTAVDYEIVNPMPWDLDKSYRENEVKEYDKMLQEFCQKSGAGYIPFYEKFMAHDYKKLLHDGAHPNAAGHQLIFETVRDYLLKNKII